MSILTDIPVALEPEEILAMRRGRPVQPGLLRDAQAAIDLGQDLWQPAAIYDLSLIHISEPTRPY